MRSAPLPSMGASSASGRARWRTVAQALRDALTQGSLEPGQLVPSTRDLAATYGVHRQTVMVALDALCAEGWLSAEPRRGYRVLAPDPQIERIPRRRRATFRFQPVRATSATLPELQGVRFPLH